MVTTETKIKMLNAMGEINLLSTYEYSESTLKSFVQKLSEIYPTISEKHIEFIMNKFFKDEFDFSPSQGLRNFTRYMPNAISYVKQQTT